MIYIHVIYLVKGMNDLFESIQWQTQGKHEGFFFSDLCFTSVSTCKYPHPTHIPFSYPN